MKQILMVQFWIKYRGTVNVNIAVNNSAENLANAAIRKALLVYNNKWPGARKDELHIRGITDGITKTIDSKGNMQDRVIPIV